MKIKDTDYLYATMNIRANEKKLLTAQVIERMTEAKSPEEAAKLLSDFGYVASAMLTFDDVEKTIDAALEDTVKTVSEACGNDYIKEVFVLKYDFHNLKAIIKANFTKQDAEHLLSAVSSVPKDVLVSSLKSGDLSRIPEKMAEAYKAGTELLSRTGNAELLDYMLDEVCFEMMTDAAKNSQSKFLEGYVALLCDISNLRLAVRLKRRGSEEELSKRLLSFGSIEKEKFFGKDFRESLAQTSLSRAAELGEQTAEGKANFSSFERELDIAVLEYMKEAKYVPFDERPIVAYLASREADASTVRIIMSGKIMGLSPDEIRSRLRVV